ncbi:MAG: LemA family protein [Sulfurimonas sp.]|nr:LemA family protein [Sulfurimonas sp.]
MQSLLIALIVIAIVVAFLYNFLISKKNQVENIFASVDTLLKKRFDLIPSLVATVQEAMKHEKSTLKEITSLRSQAMKPDVSSDAMVGIDKKLSSLLSSVMVAVEDYPELKANENILNLQHSLSEVEEQLSAGRRAYNQSVTDYNNAIEMFPTNILANYMSYHRKQVFSTQKSERKNPNIRELFDKK